MYCKECNIMTCVECVEEHNEQGHKMITLSKYAALVVLPAIDAKVSASKAKDDGMVLQQELASCLTLAKDRENKRRLLLEDAIRQLAIDPEAFLRSLGEWKQQIQNAIVASDNAMLNRLCAERNTRLAVLSLPDAQKFHLTKLISAIKEIMQGWAAEDAFYSDLYNYILKLSTTDDYPPFIHTFNSSQWGTLVLYNLKTQQAVKQRIERPSATTSFWVSSAQVRNSVFMSGGCVNNTYVATAIKVTVDSKLAIKQQNIADMKIPKACHMLVVHNDTSIFSLGGYNGTAINCCECYNIITNTWELWKPLNCTRDSCSGCSVYPQFVFCFGGFDAKSETWLEILDVQSPTTGWRVVSISCPSPFVPNGYGARAFQIDSDSILLFGDKRGSNPSCIYKISKNVCEAYQTLASDERSFSHSYPINYNGRVYAMGHDKQEIHEYTIATNTWKCTPLPA
jgi:hypothetical protein